jgi:hypothetical protein
MAHDFCLFPNRQVRLAVFWYPSHPGLRCAIFGEAVRPGLLFEEIRGLTALIDEVLRKPQISFLASRSVQSDQRELNLLVTAILTDLPLTAAENPSDVVGQAAAANIEQRGLASGLKVCHTGFQHMSDAAELVSIAQVAPTLLDWGNSATTLNEPVRLLPQLEVCHHLLKPCVECRVGVRGQAVRGCLNPRGINH